MCWYHTCPGKFTTDLKFPGQAVIVTVLLRVTALHKPEDYSTPVHGLRV